MHVNKDLWSVFWQAISRTLNRAKDVNKLNGKRK